MWLFSPIFSCKSHPCWVYFIYFLSLHCWWTLVCFQLSAFINHAALNVLVMSQYSWMPMCTYEYNDQSWVHVFINLLESAKWFFKVILLIYNTISNIWEFKLLHIQHLLFWGLLYFVTCGVCNGISYFF